MAPLSKATKGLWSMFDSLRLTEGVLQRAFKVAATGEERWQGSPRLFAASDKAFIGGDKRETLTTSAAAVTSAWRSKAQPGAHMLHSNSFL